MYNKLLLLLIYQKYFFFFLKEDYYGNDPDFDYDQEEFDEPS